MTPRVVAALAVLGTVALAVACYAAWHRHQRPPVPDVVAQVDAVARRLYLIDEVATNEGPRLCVCEPAARPEPRRAQR